MKFNPKFNYPKSIRAYYNGKRIYDVNDQKLPSVTTILSATQPAEKRESLQRWRDRVGAAAAEKITREATNRGSAMHDFLEKFCLGKLNLDLLGDNSLERQMADQIIENGLRNKVSEIYGVEATLFYPNKYAGAADLICNYEGKNSIIDFKNSSQLRKDEWNTDYYLQLSAYQMAHNKVYGTDIDQGVILVCTKDLMFQRFVIDSVRLKNYQEIFLRKVDEYYKMQLNN
jgi:ATP-dependent exoDNAse (exonuclease V) beta subunit|tara:strand:- start:1702 stop:2388 length:687 start_codon:yes stop_codon:yes gene_type:complete